MTYEEYKKFESYKCNYDCENCEYRILDTVKDVGDLITED